MLRARVRIVEAVQGDSHQAGGGDELVMVEIGLQIDRLSHSDALGYSWSSTPKFGLSREAFMDALGRTMVSDTRYGQPCRKARR